MWCVEIVCLLFIVNFSIDIEPDSAPCIKVFADFSISLFRKPYIAVVYRECAVRVLGGIFIYAQTTAFVLAVTGPNSIIHQSVVCYLPLSLPVPPILRDKNIVPGLCGYDSF